MEAETPRGFRVRDSILPTIQRRAAIEFAHASTSGNFMKNGRALR